MENIIIIGIIAVVGVIAGIYTAKHFKGKGCCGGGGYRAKKKKLTNVLYEKTFKVEGMHCENCKVRVEEVVNDMKGVAGRVDLKNNELTVSYAEEVDDELIKARLQRVGYTVI